MHPLLEESKHPLCVEYIRALQECQNGSYFARLLGACNSPKAALLACFRQEKRVKCTVNQEKQRRFQEQLVAAIEQDKAFEALEREQVAK